MSIKAHSIIIFTGTHSVLINDNKPTNMTGLQVINEMTKLGWSLGQWGHNPISSTVDYWLSISHLDVPGYLQSSNEQELIAIQKGKSLFEIETAKAYRYLLDDDNGESE